MNSIYSPQLFIAPVLFPFLTFHHGNYFCSLLDPFVDGEGAYVLLIYSFSIAIIHLKNYQRLLWVGIMLTVQFYYIVIEAECQLLI